MNGVQPSRREGGGGCNREEKAIMHVARCLPQGGGKNVQCSLMARKDEGGQCISKTANLLVYLFHLFTLNCTYSAFNKLIFYFYLLSA